MDGGEDGGLGGWIGITMGEQMKGGGRWMEVRMGAWMDGWE